MVGYEAAAAFVDLSLADSISLLGHKASASSLFAARAFLDAAYSGRLYSSH